ncbi:MAG TPA: hypothetical protein VN922_08035 [Bacteroidia bacterium]|nr:hypothetical protein [Bacteroidia bacterium]
MKAKSEIKAISGLLNKPYTKAQDKPAIKAMMTALYWVIDEATSMELVHSMKAEPS